MRKGLELKVFELTCATALMLAGLTAGSAQTPGSAPEARNEASPKVFAKRFYRAPGGQFYVPAGVPLRMSIGLATPSEGAGQNPAESSDEAPAVLKEGPSSVDFGGAIMRVIADGTPPQTTLKVDDSTDVEEHGLRVFAPHPKLRLSATDALSGVSQTLFSVDGAPFVPLPAGGPDIAAEGEHTLRYFSVDQVGNVESVHAYAFRVDGTPPRTKLDVAGPRSGAVVGVGASISLAAQDEHAGVETIRYRLDEEAEQSYSKPIQLDDVSEGAHHLRFFARDRVGNTESAQGFAFIADRQPPEIGLAIHGRQHADKGVRYIAADAEIVLTSQDAVAGATPVRYRIDNASIGVYSAPFHLPGESGIHRLRIESEDQVGNRAEMLVNDIYVDHTAPTTDVEYSQPYFVRDGVVVLNPHSLIALNTSDLESGIEKVKYSVDGGAEQPYSQPFSISEEGEHRLAITSVDRVGNREQAKEIRLRIQTQQAGLETPATLDARRWYLHPKLGLIGPPGLPFELRITDSPAEGAESFLIDPGPNPGANAEPLAFQKPGKNKISMMISPKAEGFGVSIDAAPPKTQLMASGARRVDAGGVTYFGPGLRIALASEDDGTGIVSGLWKTLYSLDGAAFSPYKAPLDDFSREGAYTLRYYALDNVGNAEKVHTFAFTVDTSAPRTRIELKGAHHGDTVTPTTQVALVTTDNLSGTKEVQYSIDGGKQMTYGSPFAIGPLSEGAHQLRYSAVDAAGNREEEHTWAFAVASTVNPPQMEVRGHSTERAGTVYMTPGCLIALRSIEGDAVYFALDNGEAKLYSAAIAMPDTGNHRLSYFAEDDLGNRSAMRTVNLVIDRTPPGSRVHFDGPQLSRDELPMISGATRIVLEANAEAAGASTLEYSLDGRHWQAYTTPFTVKSPGTFGLSYRARNALGTVGPVEGQRIVVDSQGPVIDVSYSEPVQSGADGVAVERGTLLFVSAADTPAGLKKITWKMDDELEREYRNPLTGFAAGITHTITIVAEDLLGNQSRKTVRLRVKEATQ
jgi:hypothetical protein